MKSLENYILKQTSFLSEDLCNETINQLEKETDWQQHTFYFPRENKSKTISGNQELEIISQDKIKKTNLITKKLWNGIQNYVKNYNFPWFDSWEGYVSIGYNRYSQNKKMALHCDHINSIFDGSRKGIPILSCVGVFNDDYEGGEFIILEDLKIDLKKGDLLIFPSNFLYPHEVRPVKKGTRYSYVSWVW